MDIGETPETVIFLKTLTRGHFYVCILGEKRTPPLITLIDGFGVGAEKHLKAPRKLRQVYTIARRWNNSIAVDSLIRFIR